MRLRRGMREWASLGAAALAAMALSSAALAQAYPSQNITLVVAYPAGGVPDVIARILGPALSDRLGKPVVIENRAGASSTIGMASVARATPDGHTLLLGDTSLAVAPNVVAKLSYDAQRDLAPIAPLMRSFMTLMVNPKVPAATVGELIALAKAKPGTLNFASSGNGGVSHLTGEYFKSLAGVEMQHVPYKGDTPMIIDLVAGRVSLAFGTAVAFLPYVQKGALNSLAVTNAKPSPVAPNLPTVAATLPGFEALQWFGLLMPAGTPADIVAKLNAEVVKILKLPEVRERLQAMGIEIAGNSPEQFAAFMRSETTKWGRIVKDSGAKID